MLLASLPRKISPSEKVTLPVTLFATEKNIKNVSVQIKTNSLVKVSGNQSQIVTFSQPDEKMAYFNLEVGQVTGIEKIQIIDRDQLLFLQDNSLYCLNNQTKTVFEIDIVEKSFQNFYYKDQILAIFTDQQIKNFKIKLP